MDQYFIMIGTEQMYNKNIIFKIPAKAMKDTSFFVKMSRISRGL